MHRLLFLLGVTPLCLQAVTAKGCPSCKPDLANEITLTFGCSLLTSPLPSAGICRQAGLGMRQAPMASCLKQKRLIPVQ